MSLERDLPLTYFNPCLREGGDQYGDEYQCNPADFNPRLREGGDVVEMANIQNVFEISIHASAKEATSDEELYEVFGIISIHASAKEATPVCSDIVYQ